MCSKRRTCRRPPGPGSPASITALRAYAALEWNHLRYLFAGFLAICLAPNIMSEEGPPLSSLWGAWDTGGAAGRLFE